MSPRKFHFSTALLPTGWHQNVVVSVDEQGWITAVTTDLSEGEHISGAAIPALANVHSHAHQRLMAGLAESAGPTADSFWTWRETMYGFALKLSPDDLEAVAAQAYVEMLKAGYSCVGEFQYLHHQPDGTPYDEPAEMSLRCLSAADSAGIAITILPTLYTYGGFGGQPPTSGQRRFINDQDQFLNIYETLAKVARQYPLRGAGIAPHSLRAITTQLLTGVLEHLPQDTRIHIHVAEQLREVDDCMAWSGLRPLAYLAENFALSNRWCAIHATHMTPIEIEILAKSGAVAGLCPTTEANLGDGIFPAVDYAKVNGAWAIGSDSHISISPAEELRQLEYSQRLRDHTRNALAANAGSSTGATLYAQAASGGAQCLDQPMGAIAIGKRCDIAVLDEDHPALIGRTGNSILDSWIFSGGNPCVKDMIVGGQHVVRGGHHVNEEQIKQKFQQTVRRLS